MRCVELDLLGIFFRLDFDEAFDWLLHALNEMRPDDASGVVRVQDGDARAVVRLISTESFRFSQTNRFNVEPTYGESADMAGAEAERKARFPDQWHLSARTEKPAREIRFLAVVVPYRASEPEPSIELLESAGARGFRVAGAEVAAWWGAGVSGKISLKGLTGEGRLVVRVSGQGNPEIVVSP